MYPSRPKAITENLTSTWRSRPSTYWCGTGISSYCCVVWTTSCGCQLCSCCGQNTSSWKIDKCVTYIHMYTRLTALFPGLPGWASTRKVKPIWILLKLETMSGSGISWAICMSAPRSRQITMPAPYHSVFTGRMPFLPPNQQRKSTEGKSTEGFDAVGWAAGRASGL